MNERSRDELIERILDRYGPSFCEELGIPIGKNTPSPLFRLLVFSLLSSARINYRIALKASAALSEAGWRTAAAMRDARWEDRVRILNESGYARYDESTSTMLGKTSARLLEDYGGDLRRLRAAADGGITAIRERLRAFTGIGDVGTDIFLREVQIAWKDVYPFIDRRSLDAAKRLGIADSREALADCADGAEQLARLDAALIRISLEKTREEFGGS